MVKDIKHFLETGLLILTYLEREKESKTLQKVSKSQNKPIKVIKQPNK